MKLIAEESNFEKEIALKNQTIEHLTEKANKLESREKELITELKQQKKETLASSGEAKAKYEQQIRDLTKELEDVKELNYDWEGKNEDLERENQDFKMRLEESENTLSLERQKFKVALEKL